MREFNREQWLELTPEVYLAEGYLDEHGRPRQDLAFDYATAATVQLAAADASAQELGFVFEAFQLLLPEYDGPPRRRVAAALAEARETVARAIRRPVNDGIVGWLNACAARVDSEAELEAFIAHARTVTQRYAVMADLLPDTPRTQ